MTAGVDGDPHAGQPEDVDSQPRRGKLRIRELESDLAAQWAQREQLAWRLAEAERRLDLARAEVQTYSQLLTETYATVSWRLTRPLRAVRRMIPVNRTRPAVKSVAMSHLTSLLFVSGAPEVARRYRCEHQAEALELLGATTTQAVHGAVNLEQAVENHAAFVLHRVPWGNDVERFVERAHELGKPVWFDTDDLVFDPDIAREVGVLADLGGEEARLYVDGLHRYRRTLLACDAAIVSTEPLREGAAAVVSRVIVTPNLANRLMLEAAEAALATKRKGGSSAVRIGYFSGTKTHNRDFLEATPALLSLLERQRRVELQLVGPLRVDDRFEQFAERVLRLPLQSWEALPSFQASVDINLAPLESPNAFSEAKSCVKWIEAGLVGVPTVATPVADVERAVDDGVNGMLARNRDEWESALESMVADDVRRRELGDAARTDVLRSHTTRARASDIYDAFSGLVASRDDPLTINWILQAPIARNSGGYRNIFRIAQESRRARARATNLRRADRSFGGPH